MTENANNEPWTNDPNGQAFEQYILDTRHKLKTAYQARQLSDIAQRLEANTPFQWYPANWQDQPVKRGVLLLHGILDSPYSLRAIGQIFLEKSYLVRSILLPGHGTHPEDLLQVSHQDWINSAYQAIEALQQTVDEVILVGFSSGASLALSHAHLTPNLKGMILISPAFRLAEKLAAFTKFIVPLGKVWHELREEIDYAKYRSISYHLAAEAYKLSRVNKKMTRRYPLQCPILMVLSDTDETVKTHAALDFFNQQAFSQDECIIYSRRPDRYLAPPRPLTLRRSNLPLYNILDYSHVCLPIAPDDPHYGLHGDYIPPLHLENTSNKRKSKSPAKKIMLGALTKENLKRYCMRRLLFNPDFAFLKQRIESFIDKTSS
jgi:esterase/lipase